MPETGQKIGQYKLVRKIGKGGFGEVWLAETADKLYAVKLPHEDQVDWEQIVKEIGIWVLCGKHPNVLPFIDARRSNGQIGIISEYAPDGSLEDLLKQKGRLSVEESTELIIGILDGLAHLSESGVIHRDLKPANILLDGKTPRLADFGISRVISADSLSSKTVSGTYWYMAPECFDGKRNEKTDIWSVGIILYRMLTGKLPFPEKEFLELSAAIKNNEFSPLPDYIPLPLQNIVAKALTKSPNKRYQKASMMREELQIFLSEFLQSKSNSDLIPYRKGDKWGYCDSNKNIIIQPKYDEVEFFNGDYAIVKSKGSYIFDKKLKIGLIDKSGSEILQPAYDYMHLIGDVVFLQQSERYGAISLSQWGVIIPFKYLSIGEFFEGFAVVEVSNENSFALWDQNPFPYVAPRFYGLIDLQGNEIIPPKYDFIHNFQHGVVEVNYNNKWGVLDHLGKEIIPIIHDSYAIEIIKDFIRIKIPESKNSDPNSNNTNPFFSYSEYKLLITDKLGNEIIPPESFNVGDFISPAFYDVYLASIRDQFDGDKDNAGLSELGEYSEGLVAVEIIYCGIGFIDTFGKLVIPPKYHNAKYFSEGLAAVCINPDPEYDPALEEWGFVDKFGNEVISFKYRYAFPFSEGLAVVCRLTDEEYPFNKKWGFIDKSGNEIISFKYDGIDDFSEGLAAVCQRSPFGEKWGFVNESGKEVISLKYDEVTSFFEGLAGAAIAIENSNAVWKPMALVVDRFGNSKSIPNELLRWGVIDRFGNEIISIKFTNPQLPQKITTLGSSTTELKYPDYNPPPYFSEGLIALEFNGKCGFLDNKGREVIEFKYEFATPFTDGLAQVKLNDKWGVINKKGDEVIPVKYDRIEFHGGLFYLELNGKPGVVDKSGNIVIEFKYDELGFKYDEFNRLLEIGLYHIKVNDVDFYIDRNGTEYYEPLQESNLNSQPQIDEI